VRPPQIRELVHEAHRCGLSIYPVQENGTKRPCGSWKSHQTRQSTLDELAGWFGTSGPDRRTGYIVVCGLGSGGLEVIDFDDADIFERFLERGRSLGLGDLINHVRAGCSVRTPRPGTHLLYRCTEIEGNQDLAVRIDPEAKSQKTLIETRGTGGYIVGAGSNGRVHPSGARYEFLAGGFATIVTLTPGERALLLDLARSFDERPRERTDSNRGNGFADVRAESAPGTAFNERATWAEVLEPHGWTLVHTDPGTGEQFWKRPGKSDPGWSATVGHNGSANLYVFSSNAHPFESRKSYTKFGAYAVLNHGGDFKAAARELGNRGFGTKRKPDPSNWRYHEAHSHGPNGKGNSTAEPRGLDARLARRHLTDLGNAERLVARYGRNLHYCHPWRKWLVYDGRRWKVDDIGAVRRRARKTARSILAEAQAADDSDQRKALVKWALESERAARIAAMLSLAEAESGIPILPDELDRDPWLFNVQNGTVDLRTDTLRPHNRGDFITRLCPIEYVPFASCPNWESTLRLVFERPDPADTEALVRYLQRLVGYALVGVVQEHIMAIAYGTGANGKSTIVNALIDTFGPDYAMKANAELIMARKYEPHPTERADLFGKRLVAAVESPADGRLNESLVKELTGGDPIRARRMREDFWEFKPTHTLILATNHKPEVRGRDKGIWRRLPVIPFTRTFEGDRADKTMPEKLTREHPGILAWCIKGCLDWQRHGLESPPEVASATDAYRTEQDTLQQFISEVCFVHSTARIRANSLHQEYLKWSESRRERPMSMTKFGREIEQAGFSKHSSNGTWYEGLMLRQSDESERDGSRGDDTRGF
jgi:putative DNA primase/helicase